jgi:hypothetical protein
MIETSPETQVAAGLIVKAAMGTGGQYDFSDYPIELHAAARAFTAGVGVDDPDKARTFFETLAECIERMPWQGDIPTENGKRVVRRDDDGKVFCVPVKNIRVDGESLTNVIVAYAANVADIHQALLPWKLEVQIRPGRVRAWQNGTQIADQSMADVTPPMPAATHYNELNDNSAGAAALLRIAETREATGDREGYLLAIMAAQGYLDWRPSPDDVGTEQS